MAVKVFISWSGDSSRRFAEALRQWLPSVIQVARPYYSSEDIGKGSRWSAEIARELEQSRVGILCLTRDNLREPWMMFEAGALSKNVGNTRVCPILFGIETTDLVGPLVQFQACRFEKNDFYDLVSTINKEAGEQALPSEVLAKTFSKFWEDLKQEVEGLLSTEDGADNEKVRSDRDILEELLQLSRTVASATRSPRVSPITVRDLVRSYDAAVSFSVRDDDEDQLAPLVDILLSMNGPLRQLTRHMPTPEADQAQLLVRQAETALNDWSMERRAQRGQSRADIDIREEDFDDIPF